MLKADVPFSLGVLQSFLITGPFLLWRWWQNMCFSFIFFLSYLSPALPMCCGYLLLLNPIFVLCKRSQSLEHLKSENSSKYFLCRATFHPDFYPFAFLFCTLCFLHLNSMNLMLLVFWDEMFCTWVGKGKVQPITCHEGTEVG